MNAQKKALLLSLLIIVVAAGVFYFAFWMNREQVSSNKTEKEQVGKVTELEQNNLTEQPNHTKPNELAEQSKQNELPPSPDAAIVVNGAVRYQTIDNFGASDAWSMDPLGKHWTEENKNTVADLLFSTEKGIGLSAWRFNIGAGSAESDVDIIPDPWRRAEAFKQTEDAPYDWSKQSGQQWFLEAAKERGVDTFIAFLNSPPVWMTKNGHAQPDPSVGSTNLKEGYEGQLAVFIADVLQHFEQKGITFDYISPINEPTWDWNNAWQEANRYNNEDLRAVILALYEELQARGIASSISAPDGVEITSLLDDAFYQQFAGSGQYNGGANALKTGEYRQYIKELLGDELMKKAVGNKIASHSYWSDYSKAGDDRLIQLREILHENIQFYDKDAKYWVTEYCILGDYGPRRNLGITPALHVARTIHYDLTMSNAAAWQWWTAVSKVDYKDGLIYTDYQKEGDTQNILTSKILWALGNYSRFIRPGAERIDLSGLEKDAASQLLGSAYLHEIDQALTIVLTNDGEDSKTVSLRLEGLDTQQTLQQLEELAMYVTSVELDLAYQGAVVIKDQSLEVTLPRKSIVTLTSDTEQKQR